MSAYQLEHASFPLRRGQAGQPLAQPAAGGAVGHAPDPRPLWCPGRGQRVLVDRHGRDHRLAGRQSRVEQGEARGRGQRRHAGGGHPGQVRLTEVRRHTAGLAPETPGKRDRRQALGPAPQRQRVHERVGGGIVALPWTADQAGRRREQHEQRDVQVAGDLVQVPGAVRLGPQHGVDPLRGQRADDAVVEHARGMHHARHRHVHTGECRGQRRPVGDVARHRPGLRAERRQVLDELGRSRRVRPSAAKQQQMPYALLRQVPGDQLAQHAGRTGHHHGSVRARGVRDGQDHLADMPRLADVAERLACLPYVPDLDGRQAQRSGLEQRDQFPQHLLDPVRARLHQVEGPIRRADLAGAADVGPAHLHEPAAGREAACRGVDQVPGEAVEHHADAAPTGGLADALLELPGPRRTDVPVVQALSPQSFPFGGARGRVHVGAPVSCELHRRMAHAACGGVNQHRFAGAQPRQVVQAVVGGQEHQGYGSGLRPRPFVRYRDQQAVVGHRGRPERALEQAGHPVAHG